MLIYTHITPETSYSEFRAAINQLERNRSSFTELTIKQFDHFMFYPGDFYDFINALKKNTSLRSISLEFMSGRETLVREGKLPVARRSFESSGCMKGNKSQYAGTEGLAEDITYNELLNGIVSALRKNKGLRSISLIRLNNGLSSSREPSLRDFDFTKLKYEIISSFPKLEALYITFSNEVSSKSTYNIEIVKLLSANRSSLKKLDLSGNISTIKEANLFAHMVEENRTLSELSLCISRGEGNPKVIFEIWHILVSALKYNNTLTSFGLYPDGREFSFDQENILPEVVRTNKSLKSLDFGCNFLKEESVESLMRAILENDSLTSLEIAYYNHLAKQGSLIRKKLEANKNRTTFDPDAYEKFEIRKFQIRTKKNKLVTKDLNEALEALKTGKITELDLSQWTIRIGAKDIISLAELLPKNFNLTTLRFHLKIIDNSNIRPLVEALEKLKKLTELEFYDCNLDIDGILALTEWLIKNQTLRTLVLRSNRIGAAGARLVADLLTKNSGLVIVDLSHNDIGDSGVELLVEALKENQNVVKLILDDKTITPMGTKLIEHLLTQNQALTEVELYSKCSTIIQNLCEQNQARYYGLIKACKKGDVDAVDKYFQQGVSFLAVSYYEINNDGPLHIACSQGNVELFEFLIVILQQKNISPIMAMGMENFNLQTPIEIAQAKGHQEILSSWKVFLSGLGLNEKDSTSPEEKTSTAEVEVNKGKFDERPQEDALGTKEDKKQKKEVPPTCTWNVVPANNSSQMEEKKALSARKENVVPFTQKKESSVCPQYSSNSYGNVPYNCGLSQKTSSVSFFPATEGSTSYKALPRPSAPELPELYCCPISHEIMKDPVMTALGKTYERKEIEKWLKDHDTDPLSNEKLPNKQLTPNYLVRDLIEEWSKSQNRLTFPL